MRAENSPAVLRILLLNNHTIFYWILLLALLENSAVNLHIAFASPS